MTIDRFKGAAMVSLPGRGKSLHGLFFIGLFLAYLYMLFGVLHLTDAKLLSHVIVRVLAVAIELLFLALLTLYPLRHWQYRRKVSWFVLYVLLLAVVCMVYAAQCYSLYVSNNFISVLAIQNASDADFIVSTMEWVMLGMGAMWLIVFSVFAWRSAPPVVHRSGAGGIVTFVVLTVLFASMLTRQRSHDSIEPEYQQAPFANLLVNARIALLEHDLDMVTDAKREDLTFDNLTCFTDPHAGRLHIYPLQKDMVYSQPLPWQRKPGAPGHPNVIIIFTEGTSAKLIGAYGGEYRGLTPNIDKLASRAMKVTDYYNHTAATFRGILGQNSSGYTYSGGSVDWGSDSLYAGIRRQTIASILDKRGYDTFFFEPEHAGSAFARELTSLGFGNLYDFEKISGLLHGRVVIQNSTNQLSDGNLYDGLTDFLEARVADASAKPFYVGLYNIGTHAFIPMVTGGVAYGDGKSQTLDKLHNYDAALGHFLDYFFNSPYAANTILVFTTDHATYPDRAYRNVAGKSLRPYFVDRVPLLIYDPTHDLPSTFDAHGRNSLALAPTVLQLLGIDHAMNSFLGASLFDKRTMPVGITALGNDFYFTTTSGVLPFWAAPRNLKGTLQCEKSVVMDYYRLEAANRLFNPEGTDSLDASDVALPARPTPAPMPPKPPATAAMAPPMGTPLCALDTLNGKPVAHNGSDVDLPAGRLPFVVTGWLVDKNHDAVDNMQLLLTSVEGRDIEDFPAQMGGVRPDVAEALQNMGANMAGYTVHGDVSHLLPGRYAVAALSKSGDTSLRCGLGVTFNVTGDGAGK